MRPPLSVEWEVPGGGGDGRERACGTGASNEIGQEDNKVGERGCLGGVRKGLAGR